MEWLLVSLPALACAGMMLLICVPMMRKMSGGKSKEGAPSKEEVAELREELARLKAHSAEASQQDEMTRG